MSGTTEAPKGNGKGNGFTYSPRSKEQWQKRADRYEQERAPLLNEQRPAISTRKEKKRWSKPSQPLQENILTFVCMDTEVARIILRQIPAFLLEGEVHRTIYDRAAQFLDTYGKAPGKGHLFDLVEKELASPTKATLYYDAIVEILQLSESINREFVLDQLQEFVSRQYLRQSITAAAEELQRGNRQATISELTRGLERAGQPGGAAGPLVRVYAADELRQKEFREMRDIAYPILQDPGILLFSGAFGSGKTMIGQGLANAVTAAEDFLGFVIAEARSALYMDGELPANVLQQRDKMIRAESRPVGGSKLFYWSAADCYPAPKPNFADRSQIPALVAACAPYDLVFLDNVSALTSGVDLNTAEAWEGILEFAMQRRHAGKSTVLVQHTGKEKSRGPRGSSRQEDLVDTSLMLEKITATGGNSAVKMTCRKLRNHPESDFAPLEIEFVNDGGGLRFKYRTLQESKSERMAQEYRRLLEDDLVKPGTQATLAKEFNLDKGAVSKIASRVTREFRKEQK